MKKLKMKNPYRNLMMKQNLNKDQIMLENLKRLNKKQVQNLTLTMSPCKM